MSGKTKLSELKPAQRNALLAAAAAELALKLWAIRDLRKRDASQLRGPKALWKPLMFVNFFGPLAYLAFGRRAS